MSKVALVYCDSYEDEKVYTAVKSAVDLLGGISAFAEEQEKILIKPNLLKKAEVDKAVITHPAVVGGFARLLRESGYEHLSMADSPGFGSTSAAIAGTGMEEYMERYGVSIIDYSGSVEVKHPEGFEAKSFPLPKELLEADAVFSLCKMKTHALERITGAVKNSYGFIYGTNKAIGHTLYPTADVFARMLVDLNNVVKPRLYLMDGIIAMEGNGPGSGEPTRMNVILASADPVALDSVFARLVYLDPALVPTCRHGNQLGLGHMSEDHIEILTVNGPISMQQAIETCGNPNFDVPREGEHKSWLSVATSPFKLLRKKKPVVIEDRCVKCGVCVNSCAVEGKAISFANGKDKPPVYNYKKCIRCFCCQEMCPEKAITVK